MTDEIIRMAYSGSRPWHGKGADLSEGADIETWKREAGLNFIVAKAPVRYAPDGLEGGTQVFADRFVTFRKDTGTPLGVVSDKYKIVQPAEIIDFYRKFVEAGSMTLETAGTLLDSRRVWGLARLDHEIKLPGGDVTRPYFLLTTSYDGETATIGTFTGVRVVCWNTLNMAYEQREGDKVKSIVSGFSIGHMSTFKPAQAQAQTENLIRAANEYEARAQLLAQTGVNDDAMLRYFVGLVGKEDQKGHMTKQSAAKIDRLIALYRSGPGAQLASAKGTAFGLLNAVTRFVDHEAPERKSGNGRLVSAWYGAGKTLKNRAMSEALALAA